MSVAIHKPLPPMSIDAFLEWEWQQPDKHEYVAGHIYAMSGGSLHHATVGLNIATALKSQLRGGRCRVYNSDAQLKIGASDSVYYPDIAVSCHFRDHNSSRYLSQASVVMEVLSPSTVGYDRGEKFARYRELETLVEYVLVDIDARRVEVFRRDTTGHWGYEAFEGDEARVALPSVEASLTLAQIFEDLPPPETGAAAAMPAPLLTESNEQ